MTPQDSWYGTTAGVPDAAAPRRRLAGRIVYWTLTGLAAAIMAGGLVLAAASLRPYTDPGSSMENTIPPGTRFLADPGAAVRRGDLVLFPVPPGGPAAGQVLKRLIGLPGDHVACCDARGRVTVDGKPLDETYLYPGDAPSTFRFSVALRGGQAWVLGDHRSISYDSREYGPVPLHSITGRVVLVAGHGSFTFTPVRTPRTFVAGGLAPPDQRDAWPVRQLAAGSAGLGALIALAAFGVIRALARRRAARRPA